MLRKVTDTMIYHHHADINDVKFIDFAKQFTKPSLKHDIYHSYEA